MNLFIGETAEQMGLAAAEKAEDIINRSIGKQGHARIVLSTGASQFPFFQALAERKVDWSKVEMFHLDEYVGISESHVASFRKYLKERFLSFAKEAKTHFVNGEGDVEAHIARLSRELKEAPIDLAVVGIGENAHIAFNDPPADFVTKEAYKVVELDEACKAQQVREGWFETIEDVPRQAITMSVNQILNSKVILSCVPHKVKADAVRHALQGPVSETVPASILKTHSDWWLYLDQASAAGIVHQ
jgi:glucosamine-6-phosphate deaminase